MPVSLQAGVHKFGPDNAALRVKTGRQGAASKVGHDLVIDVTSWGATLDVGKDRRQVSLELNADPDSLRILEGTGGVQPLGDEDRADIQQTIDDEVLKGESIEFRSTDVGISDGGRRLSASGDLNMAGSSHRVEIELSVNSKGEVSGGATLRQTDWGIKPYSALFGVLKVADEVEVVVEARLP